MITPFEGYEISREEVFKHGWILEDSGCLAGKTRWYWERFVSPDAEFMATFYHGYQLATVERI